MSQYTPGPWRIQRDDQIVILNADESIAMLFRDGDVHYNDLLAPEDDACEANARLIAAAPDLLEAIQALVKEFEKEAMPGIYAGLALARAAIAKATP